MLAGKCSQQWVRVRRNWLSLETPPLGEGEDLHHGLTGFQTRGVNAKEGALGGVAERQAPVGIAGADCFRKVVQDGLDLVAAGRFNRPQAGALKRESRLARHHLRQPKLSRRQIE